MVKQILEWNDKKFEESIDEEGPKGVAKAFLSGCVEGAVDIIFGVGIFWSVIMIWSMIPKRKK